jgi:hypothetical protein
MRTDFFLLQIFFCFATMGVSAQTVLKMDMPKQADRALKVVALFEEEIPEGIPVVLGLMGYEIDGGTTPYLFEWLLNNKVVSTNDIAVFTASKSDQLVLKVTDNNNCRASTSFNLKFAQLEPAKSVSIKIYPTLVIDKIQVDLPSELESEALVRILDLKGNVVYSKTIAKSGSIPIGLVSGTYFVSVKTTGEHRVEKVIVR